MTADGVIHKGTLPDPPPVRDAPENTGPFCSTCQYIDPTGYLCTNSNCTVDQTRIWYDGSTHVFPMAITDARYTNGPCGPSGSLYVAK
jgi:hypothetical protein